MKELIKSAKIIQPHLAEFAGKEGGARVWLEGNGSLRALVWSGRFMGIGPAGRQDVIWHHMCILSPSIRNCLSYIISLTPEEYEEQYFFTKPPFCEEG